MPTFRNSSTQEVREISQETVDAWVSSNNPKALVWLPYTPPEPEPDADPVPSEVGPAQLRIAIVLLGWFSPSNPQNADAEIDNWLMQMVPNVLMNPNEQLAAYMLLKRATVFRRDHPFMLALALYNERTEEDLDNLFRTAAAF